MASTLTRDAMIDALSCSIDEALQPLLPRGSRCALLDFPSRSNFGDSAIWLGEQAWLLRHGITVVYTSGLTRCNVREVERRLGRDGVILLSGGGNFGDLHPSHQRLREAIISAFPRRPIIQLPQSVWFREPANARRATAVLDRHPRLVLFIRDQQSLEVARNAFRAPSILCPDMAFALGPLQRSRGAVTDTIWLVRRDKESSGVAHAVRGFDHQVDWSDGPITPFLRLAYFVLKQVAKYPRKLGMLHHPLSLANGVIAKQCFETACRILSQGTVVITDRLHGHILSLLLGIPHVVLDNNYGKVKSFYETWTNRCELASWADSPPEAAALARSMTRRAGNHVG